MNPSSYVTDEGVPFLLGGDIREFRIDTGNCNKCSPQSSDGPLRKSRLDAGDLVVVRVGYPGVAAVVPPELARANCASMMLIRHHKRFHSPWLAYLFNSQVGRDQIEIVQYGAAQKQFNISHAVDFEFPFPPLPEQTDIAEFLDRETGRIDRLVAKKRELIERLKEKRTALISRTVTRGLPPAAARAAGLPENPRLNPSGLDWLGDIPTHWGRANKLARLASRRKHSFVNGPFGSDLLTSEISDEGVPVIYIRDISAGRYSRTSDGCVTPDKDKQLNFCRVDPGDVLIAKVGDPPGAAAVYPASEPSGIVTQDVIRIRVDESWVSASYLAYFLNSSAGRGLIDQIAIESRGLQIFPLRRSTAPRTSRHRRLSGRGDGEAGRVGGEGGNRHRTVAGIPHRAGHRRRHRQD